MVLLVPIVPSLCILLLCFVIGFVGNTALIITTIQSKRLHNANNIFIALSALGDIIHQIGHLPFAYFIFTEINFITLRTCIWIQLIPCFGLNFATIILILTALDRAIAILKPLRYRNMRKKFYISAIILPSVLYSVAMVAFVFIHDTDNDIKVICTVTAIYSGQSNLIWITSAILIILTTIVLYAALSRVLVRAGRITKNFELLQTLKLIVAFIGLGHLATLLIFISTRIFISSSKMTSTEYRNEFRRQLGKFLTVNAVNPSPKHEVNRMRVRTVHL